MIHILHDTSEGYPFIAELLKKECVRHYSPQRFHKYISWFIGSWNVIFTSKPSDIIICVYDFQAVICYWISLLLFRPRRILGINILLKNKNNFRNKIARFLYRKALKSKYFTATVSTPQYGLLLSKWLNIDCNLPLLRDVFYSSYLNDAIKIGSSDGRYVFCGGRNGRDWNFIIQVARNTPDIEFCLVIPYKIVQSFTDIPSNISLHYDIPYSEFNRLLSQATVVALPLETEAPAGLIVVFQAAAFKKGIIMTDTASTHDYLCDGKGFGLDNDVLLWSKTIKNIFEDKHYSSVASENLLSYLQNTCSEERYVDRIRQIVEQME